MILYTYYLTLRPAGIGAVPKEGLLPTNPSGEFEERIPIVYPNPFYDPNLNPNHPMTMLCNAHGFVQYDRPVDLETLIHYDMVPAPVRKTVWHDHRVIGYVWMTQETADMLNAMPGAVVYYGSNQPHEMQGTEDE